MQNHKSDYLITQSWSISESREPSPIVCQLRAKSREWRWKNFFVVSTCTLRNNWASSRVSLEPSRAFEFKQTKSASSGLLTQRLCVTCRGGRAMTKSSSPSGKKVLSSTALLSTNNCRKHKRVASAARHGQVHNAREEARARAEHPPPH
jgi:hypothetical protein